MSHLSSVHVAIVGGGPAGGASALALLDHGFTVTLIERSDYTDFRVGEHLTPDAVPNLARLDVLRQVQNGPHRRCHGVRSAWGESEVRDGAYIFNPYGDGFNLSRPAFDLMLADQAERRGASVLKRTRLVTVRRYAQGWRIGLARNGETLSLEADFVVDATGRSSRVAKGSQHERINYDNLLGIIGVLSPDFSETAADAAVLVESCEDGWWYSARLFDGRVVTAYMTDADIVAAYPGRPPQFWRERLDQSRHTRKRLRGLNLAGRIRINPARTQRLDAIGGPGWFSVGDAAMCFDPLSSRGISTALNSGIRVAEVICSDLGGNAERLQSYQAEANRAFNEYLSTRAEYYRVERRWPTSLFWTRRHRRLPREIPVTMDPMTFVITRKAIQPKSARLILEEAVPGLDGELLVRLARSSVPAHRLVSLFKEKSRRQHEDRDIIIAVQSLLKGGILTGADKVSGEFLE